MPTTSQADSSQPTAAGCSSFSKKKKEEHSGPAAGRYRTKWSERRTTPSDVPAAKKSLGQHFLRRPDICERIADLIHPQADDCILEIGPGPGALTKVLEARPHSKLVLIEKDEHWAAVRQAEGAPGTDARCADALAFPWESLEGDWKIIGNLPYNVASPLIWEIALRCRALTEAAFMIQKEVGQRLTAAPGSKHYGALSVWVQAFCSAKMAFTVGPAAFSPPPKVDSAVVAFRPLPLDRIPKNPEALSKLLKLCFQQRRKQLGGLFRKQKRDDLVERLAQLGIRDTARPEELTIDQFISLAGADKQD